MIKKIKISLTNFNRVHLTFCQNGAPLSPNFLREISALHVIYHSVNTLFQDNAISPGLISPGFKFIDDITPKVPSTAAESFRFRDRTTNGPLDPIVQEGKDEERVPILVPEQPKPIDFRFRRLTNPRLPSAPFQRSESSISRYSINSPRERHLYEADIL